MRNDNRKTELVQLPEIGRAIVRQPNHLARNIICLYDIALEREEITFKPVDDNEALCCVPYESKEHYTCMNDGGLKTTTLFGKMYLVIATLSKGGMICA